MSTKEFKNKVLSLSDRLFPMVARILGSNTNAEDAIQEIMMKLWIKRKQIGKHPNITGFVFLTARNYCMDLLKKKKLELEDSSFVLNTLDSGKTGLELLELKEMIVLVDTIIKKLPEQQSKIILMRDIDGLEFIEIAAIMQLKIEHIRVLLSRARKRVGIEFKNIYYYEQG
jgi:RNA polymerase sigma-70 factor, ECF subfamily